MKILAIKFKYLGDVVIMVPALRALRAMYPQAELHVLVAEEAAPLIDGIPWITTVWALPRSRGKARLADSLPIIRALRSERFDKSVDFVGNDRGALLSFFIHAKERLGVRPQAGHRLRRLCYTHTIEEQDTTRHECVRDYYVLTAWGVKAPQHWELELALKNSDILSNDECRDTIVCHLSTSQEKKEWAIEKWVQLAQLLEASKFKIIFSSGPSTREQSLLTDFKNALPTARILTPKKSLVDFMHAIAHAQAFISPDTAPLHIAAGLGIPTIGLFGPTSSERWAPIGKRHCSIKGSLCPCNSHLATCTQPERSCTNTIEPMAVFKRVMELSL